MKVKIFGKQGCARCETTKNKFHHFLEKHGFGGRIVLEFHDMDTVDGMAEGMYYDVMKIPTSVIERERRVLARWEGEIPNTEELSKHFEELPAKV